MKLALLLLSVSACFAGESRTNKTVFLGDSQMDHAFSWVNYGSWKSLGRLTLVHNSGVSGDSTQGMVARLSTDVWAYNPEVLVYSGSMNDLAVPLSGAQSLANLIAISQAAKARGIIPCLVTLAPKTGATAGTATMNAIILSAAASENIPVFNLNAVVADGAGEWANAAWTADGTHLSDIGAGVVGAAFVASTAFATIYAHTNLLLAKTNTDPASLTGNSLFATTSVGSCGQTIPTNWGCSAGASGGTVTTPTFSFVTDGVATGTWLRSVIVAGNGYWVMGPAVTLTVGHVIDVSFRIRISGLDATSGEGSFLLQNTPATLEFHADTTNSIGHARFTATTGAMYFWLKTSITGSYTVDIAQLAIVDLTTQGATYNSTGTWIPDGIFPAPGQIGPVR